ncbi:interphotoreceptor matrix proteoglycan 2-like [Oncorhynchus keta]|uniref:interphotoreceptor matrix proteoglycan 2-like n=1 Tax=Oncorhynchus keta TaxID=8018 RepID=UPI00227B3260|nr:interphotoreceptor matrix proteoglycan 2-like [Oncorhynchus keta]
MCSTSTPATEQEAQGEVIIEGAEVELPTEPTNDIEMEVLEWPTRAQLEQVVELSILLKGERYSDALRDTASFQYQTLNQQFIDKIEDALGGLPGLKSVTVLEFSVSCQQENWDLGCGGAVGRLQARASYWAKPSLLRDLGHREKRRAL